MRIFPIACTMILGLAAAGCASSMQSPPTFDTGSMALPQPRASGTFQRAAPTGVDTGSMALPSVQRTGPTVSATQSAGPDTGSMASPTPRSSGTIPTRY